MANENEMLIEVGGSAKQWFDTVEQIKKKNKNLSDQINSDALEVNRYKAKLNADYLRLTEEVAKNEKAIAQSTAAAKIAAAQQTSSASIKASQAAADAAVKADQEALTAAKESQAELESLIGATAKVAAVAFAASAAAVAGVTSQFIDYEKALVGVGKTTNINGDDLKSFGREFQKLSGTIPIATNELLGIAQAAGQLGVRGQADLLKFTEVVGKLGVATDLSGEDAAVSLTRILTVTREGVKDIDKFGSVIVALGNNFAASESEIVRVATEVSRSTAVFNVSAAQAAALSAAMRSLGVQAELGGSAVGRTFRAISSAIEGGGKSLQNLSNITGIAAGDLKEKFGENSTAVFQKFIEGLGQIAKEGGSTTAALKMFGLRGEEILKVIPVLALNSELLGRALNTAAKEMENSTALNKEASTAFATLGADVQRTKNNFTTLGTSIGEQLAPEVSTLLSGLGKIATAFTETTTLSAGLIATILKLVLAITGSASAVAAAALVYIGYKKVMDQIAIAANVARASVVGFTTAATLGLSLIIAFLPEIIEGIGTLLNSFEKKPELQGLDEITNKLIKLNKERDNLERKQGGSDFYAAQISQLDQQIAKLKEIQQERLKADKDFGTGSLLIQPTMAPLNALPGDISVPLADDKEVLAREEETQRKKLEIGKRGSDKKTQQAKDEAARLQQIRNLEIAGYEKDEIALVTKRLQIGDERRQAELERDTVLKDALLRVNDEKLINQDLQEQAFYQKRMEDDLKFQEQKIIFDQIAREEEIAVKDMWTEEDREKMIMNIQTDQDIEKAAAQDKIARAQKDRAQYAADEKKGGKVVADINKFLRSDEVQGAKEGAAELIQLTNSKNSTMKAIGKAAARVQAAISTAEGAIKAYSALSGIPFIGPALGAAAAAAITIYGVERQSQISAMAAGGFVPNGVGGMRDRIPAMLEPNELVVPSLVAPNFIQAAGIPDTQSNPNSFGMTDDERPIIDLVLNDRASQLLTLEQRQGRALGLTGAA